MNNGVLGSFDLSRAIQTGGRQATGRTQFTEMTGQGVYDRGAVALRNVTHQRRRAQRRRERRHRAERRAFRAHRRRRAASPSQHAARDAESRRHGEGAPGPKLVPTHPPAPRPARAVGVPPRQAARRPCRRVDPGVRSRRRRVPLLRRDRRASSTPPARALLERLLDDGSPPPPPASRRRSTSWCRASARISPWSSKASDIARNCGLAGREAHRARHCLFTSESAQPGRSRPLLHDRMTADGAALASTRPRGCSSTCRRGRCSSFPTSEEGEPRARPRAERGRDRVPRARLPRARARPDRRRAHHVRAGELGALPAQDLQRRLDHRRRAPAAVAVRHDPAHARGEPAGHGARLRRQRRDHRRARGARASFPTQNSVYEKTSEPTHIVIKCETHNHPTAISPFPGRGDRLGRRDPRRGRDRPRRQAQGRAWSASRCRTCASPAHAAAWEGDDPGKPGRIASALDIMLEGPIGAAAFNNEFGRPNLCGYFRTFEHGENRGYHKPIMLAGGLGSLRARACAARSRHSRRQPADPARRPGPADRHGRRRRLVDGRRRQRRGPRLRLGAARQRRDRSAARRRCIDRCWQLGAANPILSIHDVGAGGLSNALPELAHGAGRGARLELRAIPTEDSGMSPREIWCNEAQERYVLAISPAGLDVFRKICERERCPFAVLGTATDDGRLRGRGLQARSSARWTSTCR